MELLQKFRNIINELRSQLQAENQFPPELMSVIPDLERIISDAERAGARPSERTLQDIREALLQADW
jgi:hypothetical protein